MNNGSTCHYSAVEQFWLFSRPSISGDRAASRPPIVFSLDTLRGDYFTQHMPQTYAWAKENCAIFSNAYSNTPTGQPCDGAVGLAQPA
jgi:hypothetical protein